MYVCLCCKRYIFCLAFNLIISTQYLLRGFWLARPFASTSRSTLSCSNINVPTYFSLDVDLYIVVVLEKAISFAVIVWLSFKKSCLQLFICSNEMLSLRRISYPLFAGMHRMRVCVFRNDPRCCSPTVYHLEWRSNAKKRYSGRRNFKTDRQWVLWQRLNVLLDSIWGIVEMFDTGCETSNAWVWTSHLCIDRTENLFSRLLENPKCIFIIWLISNFCFI